MLSILDTLNVKDLLAPDQVGSTVSPFQHFQDGFVQNVHIPIVRVDPENRCAVMLIYGTKLVVLPFRKDTLTDEQEVGVGEGYSCTLFSVISGNDLAASLTLMLIHPQAQVQLSTHLHH